MFKRKSKEMKVTVNCSDGTIAAIIAIGLAAGSVKIIEGVTVGFIALVDNHHDEKMAKKNKTNRKRDDED